MRKGYSERRQAPADRAPFLAVARVPPRVRRLLRTYVPGEVIFDENENADGLYVIRTGCVRLIRVSCDRMLYAGEEHAPAALATLGLFDGGRNSVTAVALSECAIEIVPIDQFDARRHNAARGLICELTRLIRESTARLDVISLMSVRQRIARVLVAATETGTTNSVIFPCSQGQFALCLGTVREVLFRNLRQLQAEGVLHFDKRTVTILDFTALRRAAGPVGPAESTLSARGTRAWAPYLADRISMRDDYSPTQR